jgi:hypothetical protein
MTAPAEQSRSDESLKIAPPITASELLGRDVEEHYDLALGQALIHIVTVGEPDGSTRYAALTDAPLTGTQFLKFLSATSFDRYEGNMLTDEDHTADITSDWDLPDLAHGTNTEEIELLAMHKTLGSAWKLFMPHRKLFSETIYHPFYVFEGLRIALSASGEKKRSLVHNVCRNPEAKSLLDEDSPDVAKTFEEIVSGLEGHIGKVQRAGENMGSEGAIALEQEISRRISQLDRPQYLRLLTFYNIHTHYIFPEDTRPDYDDYEEVRPLQGQVVDVRYPDWGKRAAGNVYAAKALIGTNSKGGIGVEVAPDSVQNTNVLYPVLRWKRDSHGNRLWDFTPITQKEGRLYRRLAQTSVPSGLSFDSQRFNTITGALLSAYLQPDIRNTWHREVPLPGSDGAMLIGPAQIPVLALMKRNQLLGSELTESIERHAQTSGR